MEWIAGFFDQVTTFINYVWEWMTNGIYELGKEFLIVLTKAAIYTYFQILLLGVEIAHSAVTSIIEDTGLMDAVRSAYSQLPPGVQASLAFFRIPESLAVIFTAFATRWALSFVPFLGR